eukprot:351801-Chlamydomonas_euryale.AAC.22
MERTPGASCCRDRRRQMPAPRRPGPDGGLRLPDRTGKELPRAAACDDRCTQLSDIVHPLHRLEVFRTAERVWNSPTLMDMPGQFWLGCMTPEAMRTDGMASHGGYRVQVSRPTRPAD